MSKKTKPSIHEVLRQEVAEVVSATTNITIATNADYISVVNARARVRKLLGQIAETFDPIIKAQRDALETTRFQRKALESPLKVFDEAAKVAMADWTAAQERERREKEAQLRVQAEVSALARREQEIARLEAAGKTASAANLAQRPIIAPPISVESSVPTIEGVYYVDQWHFEIEDAAVVPGEYKVVDEKKVRAVVNALKSEARIPGVRVWKTSEPRQRVAVGDDDGVTL